MALVDRITALAVRVATEIKAIRQVIVKKTPEGRVGIGTDSPLSELHLYATRTAGFEPHVLIQAGKAPGNAASVGFQRPSADLQMLFAFETASSGNPDGYFGTFPGKEDAIFILSGNGAGGNAAVGIDNVKGFVIGTAGDIVGGGVASISGTGVAKFVGLELTSTTAGFLPPRMTTAQRDAIAGAAEGLTIFNVTTGTLQVRAGAVWSSLARGEDVAARATAADVRSARAFALAFGG